MIGDTPLARTLRATYGAYVYLRDHAAVLADRSTTARLLQSRDQAALAARVGEEIAELHGVLAGTHSHGGGRDDLVLEAYQALYWLCILAVASGLPYEALRPHEALAEGSVSTAPPPPLTPLSPPLDAAQLYPYFVAVAHACASGGVAVGEAVQRDDAELRTKAYLSPYWDALDGEG